MSVAAFEARYRAHGDPWGTLSDPREQAKAEATLDACGPGPFASVCDLGAGLGVLSAALAPRSRALLALDGAPTAAAAADARLAPWPCARAMVATLPEDLPAGAAFDLVVASEILYYLDDDAFAATLDWLDGALVPKGRVVAVHWTGDAEDLHRPATAVRATLAARPGLRVLGRARGPSYLLDVLERA
jgi:SAM-dependent methyltransferase